jgi:uncharacterized membrane protein AbrB (regulator of aidB expression)
MLKQINQIFTIKFISVLIISFPSAIIADYFNIPLAWFLGPNDCHINCCIIRFKNHHA